MHWSSNIKVAALKAGLANQEYSKKQKRSMFNYRTVGASGLKTWVLRELLPFFLLAPACAVKPIWSKFIPIWSQSNASHLFAQTRSYMWHVHEYAIMHVS